MAIVLLTLTGTYGTLHKAVISLSVEVKNV
jgi:hypothetical protein